MIRLATKQDAASILAIYAEYVLHDSATFEYEVPSLTEFEQRMEVIQQVYPYLVYEEEGNILGYAYAHRYKERAAYQWDVELSVYACITSPNPKSERMHERLGFQLVARFPHTGYKFEKWLDVVWMDKELLSPDVPQPIVPLASFIEQLPKDLSELLNKDSNPIK